jgi:uncharacterized membrane protein
MIPQLTEVALLQGVTTLHQLLNVFMSVLGTVLLWLGEFLLNRLEFAERYPTSALTGILVNAVALWWLVHAHVHVTFHRVVAPRILLR